MSEMAQTADQLLVIGRGRIIASGSIGDIISATEDVTVRVRAPHVQQLAEVLTARGGRVAPAGDGSLEVRDLTCVDVGEAAGEAGLILHELTGVQASLEDAFLSLTHGAVEYRSEKEGASR
jgi:ABC-2 type transport system ATP-binding protein